MSRTGGKQTSLSKAIRELEKCDVSGLRGDWRDAVVELSTILDQISRIRRGEIRIVVAGAVASMKSTTLALLLGSRAILRVGLGPVTAAPTELRLVQGDGPSGAGTVQMLTETEAALRARELLDVGVDDQRTLAELAEADHRNQPIVVDMVRSAELFGFGTRHELTAYLQRCAAEADGEAGGDQVGGLGAPLIHRIVVELSIPAGVWDLSWAKGRAVALIDLPGTGEGRALENLFRDRQQELAHVALNIVAVTGGSSFTPPVMRGSPNCVFVATKIDRVEQPEHPNELRAIEEAVASCLAEWRIGSRHARVAAISGMWAFPDETSWLAFDPKNSGWPEAQAKRAAWAAAAWGDPGATVGEFREAVEAALEDGGAKRLRRLIEELADPDDARIDELEQVRLLARADEVIDGVLTGAPVESIGDVVILQDEAEHDPGPVYELRRIAEDRGIEAIYDRPEWEAIRLFFRGDGTLRVSPAEIRKTLDEIDFSGLAGDAVRDAVVELDDALRAWAQRYMKAVGGGVAQLPGVHVDMAAVDAAAARFAALSQILLRALTDSKRVELGDGGTNGPASITFQQIARCRDELAMLLQRLVTELLKQSIDMARAEVMSKLRHPAVGPAADQVPDLMRRVKLWLRALAPEAEAA
jgi:hypothetical protein